MINTKYKAQLSQRYYVNWENSVTSSAIKPVPQPTTLPRTPIDIVYV
jgi:hypothetical protein